MTAIDPSLETWFERVRAKVTRGGIEHGDKSFELRCGDVVEEVLDELADVCGWSFVLHERLRRMQDTLERLDAVIEFERAAARAMDRFRAATRDGHPVGSTAVAAVSAIREAMVRAGTPTPGGDAW